MKMTGLRSKYPWYTKLTEKYVGGGVKDDVTTEINAGLSIILAILGLVEEV